MRRLKEDIFCYLYILNRKYGVDSVSIVRLFYKMECYMACYIKAVKPALIILIARGLVKNEHQGDRVSYAITRERGGQIQ